MNKALNANETKNILERLEEAGCYNKFIYAIRAAGLKEILTGAGPLTCFAPVDEAFQALDSGVLQRLLQPENKQELEDLLKYHIVDGQVVDGQAYSKTGAPQSNWRSLEGSTVFLQTTPMPTLDGVRIVRPDVYCINGSIRGIEAVRMPPTSAYRGAYAQQQEQNYGRENNYSSPENYNAESNQNYAGQGPNYNYSPGGPQAPPKQNPDKRPMPPQTPQR